MKYFYLTGAILLTVVILILGFGNITAQCQQLFFFYQSVNNTIPVTFLVFAVAFLGIVTGFFYSAFLRSLVEEARSEEEDEDGSGL
ncbi:hypothetical protein KKG71_03490 [Patescibacteria group bacterium]|nr:hypothetical protein [Patescibacteria group bacterium]